MPINAGLVESLGADKDLRPNVLRDGSDFRIRAKHFDHDLRGAGLHGGIGTQDFDNDL